MEKDKLSEKDLDEILEQLSQSAPAPSAPYSAEKSYHKLRRKLVEKKVRQLSFAKYAAAASIVLILSFSALLYLNKQSEMKTVVTTDYTQNVQLPDGSSVMLSRYSSLRYPSKFKKRNRKVEIEGEAYFEVTKDNKRPFVVSTENIQIQVLGTQFNVESYPKANYIKTTLVEGAVSVRNRQNEDAIILSPNESALFCKANETLHKEYSENVKDEIAWKEGKLIFNNKKMNQIAAGLSHFFNVSIVIPDSSLKEYRVTARFEQGESLDEMLNLLQSAANFNWKQVGAVITITPNN